MAENKERIRIWELDNRINIKLKPKFIDFVRNKIKSNFKPFSKFYNILNTNLSYYAVKNRLKRSYVCFVDLELLLEVCFKLNISKEELERNIIAYKTRKGQGIIENPILPIKLNPLFDALLSHHIGDGNTVNPKRGRKIYFSYRQYNKENRMNYYYKLCALFGKVIYKNNYFETETRIYCPAVLSNLFFRVYGVKPKFFLSDKARIPKELLSKEKEHLLAFLLAMIVDEGNVDSTCISIRVKNVKLAKDLSILCSKLNYENSFTFKEEYGNLWILKKGIKKLYNDYIRIIKKYPSLNLGYKERILKRNLSIGEREIKRIPGNKKIIIKLLSKESLSINEIAYLIKMTRQGVRYHLKQLEQRDIVYKTGKIGKGNIIRYHLKEG